MAFTGGFFLEMAKGGLRGIILPGTVLAEKVLQETAPQENKAPPGGKKRSNRLEN
jgi:hypothetical protein